MEFTPDTHPDISHFKGPMLAGFIFSTVLYGANVGAFVSYAQFSWASDRRGTRALVLAVAAVATSSMSFLLFNTHRQFGIRYGLAPAPEDAKLDSVNYLLEGCMHVLVAGYFARRGWCMYGRKVWIGLGLGLLILSTAVGTTGAFVVGMTQGLAKKTPIETAFNLVMIVSQLGGDIIITSLIVIKLLISKTGFKHTDTVIQKLVMVGIETQAPPAFVAIAFLITYLTSPHPTYLLAFTCYPMVYAMSLLAALDSRYTIKVKLQAEGSSGWKEGGRSRRGLPMTSINVHTETYTHAAAADHMMSRRTTNRGAGRLAESTESLQENKGPDTSEVRLV